MVFLQGITKHADKLGKCAEPKVKAQAVYWLMIFWLSKLETEKISMICLSIGVYELNDLN